MNPKLNWEPVEVVEGGADVTAAGGEVSVRAVFWTYSVYGGFC